MDLARKHLEKAQDVLNWFLADDQNIQQIEKGGELLATSLENDNKVLSCGNGGSMSDSMHFAEELVGKFRDERRALPAIALGADPSFTSCTSNDFGYEYVFERGVEAFGQEGDVLMGISTSGNSGNVIKAVDLAHQKGMKVIGLTGKDGGKMAEKSDIEIRVPHFAYADRIQEIHIKVIHTLIDMVEKRLGISQSK